MKPLFLDSPGHWTHAPRTSQTAADLGCAIERPVRRPYGALWWGAIVVLCVASAVLIVVGR